MDQYYSVHAGVLLHPSVPAAHDLMALDYIESIQALHRPKNSEVGVVGPVRLFLSEEVSINPLGHLVQLVLEVLTGWELEHLRSTLAHHAHDEAP